MVHVWVDVSEGAAASARVGQEPGIGHRVHDVHAVIDPDAAGRRQRRRDVERGVPVGDRVDLASEGQHAVADRGRDKDACLVHHRVQPRD